jgi:catechol 2,3-dioxygenase-like lactoylglutathione lyase family enzyme
VVDARYTHVSIVADDLEESVAFYESVFGLERIPTPAFDGRVQWLQCGDRQLHLAETDADPPAFNHVAVHVDDFEAVFASICEHDDAEIETPSGDGGSIDGEPPVYVLPSGAVQLYVRDPGGNRVEVNAPDADALDKTVVRNLVERTDVEWPAPGESAAPLYLPE